MPSTTMHLFWLLLLASTFSGSFAINATVTTALGVIIGEEFVRPRLDDSSYYVHDTTFFGMTEGKIVRFFGIPFAQ